MSPSQSAAFQAGAGLPAGELLLGIALIAALLYLLWLVWVTQGYFRAWVEERATLFDLLWGITRAAVVVLLIGFIMRP